MYTRLIIIFNDQLSLSISSLKDYNKKSDIILMSENYDDMSYVKHHKKKLVFIISAMRHFKKVLENENYNIIYSKLEKKKKPFNEIIIDILKTHNIKNIILTEPSEYRIYNNINILKKKLNIEIRKDDRFLCSIDEFKNWAKNRKELRMEYFYREMRKKYNILMDGKKPKGDKWNFDSENRKPPSENLNIPKPYYNKKDQITEEVIKLIETEFPNHFGDIEPFYLAVTRNQALQALSLFIKERLNNFGSFQDAMIENEPFMYHSHISFYLNIGLLTPLECIKQVEEAKNAPINAIEGFIRQILGWREYIRGIYWLKMPEYKSENYLEAKNKLPDFFWTGKTKMNCLRQVILETKQNAYAHHIQRLMIIGNFALLTSIDPKQVNEWFLIVYADAYEWVELPNVSGMSLFADGGFLGSKPYAAGGSYINKMSNYCSNCSYKIDKKTGIEACPFNYLYWNFLIKNRNKLIKNQRMKIIYSTLNKMSEEKIIDIQNDSKKFLKHNIENYNN